MEIENEIYQYLLIRVFIFFFVVYTCFLFLFFIFFFSLLFVFGFPRPAAAIVAATVGNAVNITEFNVPGSYVIEDEENPGTLILDCAYESEPNEKGVVLKWLLNGTLIYQWIPDSPPAHSFVSIQSHPNDLI